jgi:hypothetical protein
MHANFLLGFLFNHEDRGAIYSPETLVDFHQAIWRYITEDRTLQTNIAYCCMFRLFWMHHPVYFIALNYKKEILNIIKQIPIVNFQTNQF